MWCNTAITLRLRPFAALACAVCLLPALSARGGAGIHFRTRRAGFVSMVIRRADGAVVRQILAGEPFAAGDHEVSWDGLGNGTPGAPLPPGNYTWSAVIHDGLGLRLRGWVGDWGGDRGVPSAAAADDAGVYLGWSLATENADTVVACNTDGAVRWTHHRGPLSGCRGLAVDEGLVFVLGGENGDADGGTLYRLNAKDGSPVPWSTGITYLKITSLWGANGKGKPVRADYLAVKNGRIYLSFANGNFVSILDAKTGAHLQTIVGSPPGPIDSVATKSDTPDEPGNLVDADFIVTALKGGIIGKLLAVHDPIWVVASDLTPLGHDGGITALTMIGDGAKHHMHDIFVAFAPPTNQVQARPALDSENCTYTAGKPGARAAAGPWEPDRLGSIRAIALDSSGQLWVAEGEAAPKRVSVWTTDQSAGVLVREFFAPPDSEAPAAISPRDPMLMVAGGCEWRLNPKSGRAKCLGIITRDPARSARFAMKNGRFFLALGSGDGAEHVLERFGDGDYRPYDGAPLETHPPKFQLAATYGGSWQLATASGYALGTLFQTIKAASQAGISPPAGSDWPPQPDAIGIPSLTQTSDGKIFLTAGRTRVWNLELTGLETLRPLASGKVALPPADR